MTICAPFRRSDDSYAPRFQRSLILTKEAFGSGPKKDEEINASLQLLAHSFESMRKAHGFDLVYSSHDSEWNPLHEAFKFRLPVWKAVDEVLVRRNELYVGPSTTMKARAGIFQEKISQAQHRLAVVELARKTEEEWLQLGGYVLPVLDLMDRPPFDEKSGLCATRFLEDVLSELITAVGCVCNNGNPVTATQKEVEDFLLPAKNKFHL